MHVNTGIAILLCAAALPLSAQSVDPKLLLDPPGADWLTYHGDYTGQRHSKLTQITPDNIGKLKQIWKFQANPADQSVADRRERDDLYHGARQSLGD